MTLDNLVRIHQLNKEAPDQREINGLIKAAVERLNDAENKSLAYASRFDLAYNAAHGLSLAALRAAGYRTDKRYLVFQCLVHTTDIEKKYVRLFAACHEKRNLAEYEGDFNIDEQLLSELIMCTKELSELIDKIQH